MLSTHAGATRILIQFLSSIALGEYGTTSITVRFPWTIVPNSLSGCSDMLAPPLWSTISTVMGIGFTARQAIPICFFGFFICGGVIGLTRYPLSRLFISKYSSRIGAMYHVPFPVVARVAFGMWGCIPAILVRTFVALMVSVLSIWRLIISGLLLPRFKVEDISRT